MYEDLILRWSFGSQDTTSLNLRQPHYVKNAIWLFKLSVASFQKWFTGARFIIFYNGDNIEEFVKIFDQIEIPLMSPIEYVNQSELVMQGDLANPYNFVPQGVWWKWVPFRYDVNYNEISIDTDIICINNPLNWHEWLDGNIPLISSPERFSKILVNTCGDFHNHPILKNKKPFNCGIVGHRKGHDYSDRFFEITEEIKYGNTQNSLFITEQGAINVWIFSLLNEGVETFILDFEKCGWVRDFVYYINKGVKVETVHATTWHKRIVRQLSSFFERKVLEDSYDDLEFISDIVSHTKRMDQYSKKVIRRQVEEEFSTEFFL